MQSVGAACAGVEQRQKKTSAVQARRLIGEGNGGSLARASGIGRAGCAKIATRREGASVVRPRRFGTALASIHTRGGFEP